MFFDSWTSLLRIIVVGSTCYFVLILMLKVSGKRTLRNASLEGTALVVLETDGTISVIRKSNDA